MINDKIHEKVNIKAAEHLVKETREAVVELGEHIIRRMVARGYQDSDVRWIVREGVEQGRKVLGK